MSHRIIESKPASAPASAWEPVACESYDSLEGAKGAAERLHRERERYPKKPAGANTASSSTCRGRGSEAARQSLPVRSLRGVFQLRIDLQPSPSGGLERARCPSTLSHLGTDGSERVGEERGRLLDSRFHAHKASIPWHATRPCGDRPGGLGWTVGLREAAQSLQGRRRSGERCPSRTGVVFFCIS